MTKEEANTISRWLEDAARNMEEWGAYATDYFQHKYGLQTDVDLLRAHALDVLLMVDKP